jgi:hypothetical protein
MNTTETLNYISQQLNIYLGISLFIFGMIGVLWNILIFRHRSLRSNSCCTYMLVGSFASLIQLIFGLLARILAEGFQIDWTSTNIAWCKIRYYTTLCASLTALSCLVWTAMDRLFSTCRQIKWRRLNTVYVARQICLLTIIIWMIAALPTLVYTKPIQPTGICGTSSLIWSRILIYFFSLFCYGIFPWFFMSLFGILTLKHLRRIRPLPVPIVTRMARIDHQLTSMFFLQIFISIMSSVPYCTQNIYDSLTQTMIKSEYRQAQENLFLQIARLTFYFNYVSMFYVNYFSSPIFRCLSKKVCINLFKKKDELSKGISIINHPRSDKRFKRKKIKISTIRTPYGTSRV